MTNMEFYRDKIEKLIKSNNPIALCNGRPANCNCFSLCVGCEFFIPHVGNCGVERTKWLMAEHVEKPKLSKDEAAFLKLLNPECWIARDSSGGLYAYGFVPHLRDFTWGTKAEHTPVFINSHVLTVEFKFITWESQKAWSVKELLELEVE